jgi:hypothetical protein
MNDYDIIRKDRSRNGGGVCIYLRSSINYIIRQDLISSELEAVCIEIIKPHSSYETRASLLSRNVYSRQNLDFSDRCRMFSFMTFYDVSVL